MIQITMALACFSLVVLLSLTFRLQAKAAVERQVHGKFCTLEVRGGVKLVQCLPTSVYLIFFLFKSMCELVLKIDISSATTNMHMHARTHTCAHKMHLLLKIMLQMLPIRKILCLNYIKWHIKVMQEGNAQRFSHIPLKKFRINSGLRSRLEM